MKVQFEVTIDARLTDVWNAFVDIDLREQWQRHFKSYECKSGKTGFPGSTVTILFDESSQQGEVTETITERREEAFLAATYTSDKETSLFVNQFESANENQTLWKCWGNFRFHGLAKMTSLFSSGAIRERIEGDMQRFKLLLETNNAGDKN